MARFPHIGAGERFPYLDNVKPYQRKTDFDYKRYDYTATAKLCSVPWPIDYRHTVAWEDAAARDAYFEELEGRTLELSQGFTRIQLDRIALDVPLDEALTFNYIYMQVPMLTEDEPIRHEGETGLRTICAFIQDCIYLSPSTTELLLSVDMWTTYLPYLAISGLMLERGHAPMYATTASAYLQDPVSRCTDLLTPDVNFGGEASVTRAGEFKPLSTAKPIYVIASSIPYAELAAMTQATNTQATDPSYYDVAGARNGHQVGVSDYAWNTYGYEGIYNPSNPTACVDGSTPTGLYYYGFYADEVSSGALNYILDRYPLLAKSCNALFVVPSDLVTVGTSHSVGSFTWYEVHARSDMQSLGSFNLTKALFGYPSKYAEIAKLYTAPYATLELSDDLGNVVPMTVENCHSTVAISQHLNMAFPFLSWEALVTNYASTAGAATYNWAKIGDGTTESRSIPNADFVQTFLEFGIDTYELRMDAMPMAQVDTFYDAALERERAIVGYQSTMRSANTGLENAKDSNATANTNALESNTTAKSNASASNLTAKMNADNDAGNEKAKANKAIETINDKADATDSNMGTTTSWNNNKLWLEHYLNNSLNNTGYNIQQADQMATRIVSATAQALTGNFIGAAVSAGESFLHYHTDYALLTAENSYRYDMTDTTSDLNEQISGFVTGSGKGVQRLYQLEMAGYDASQVANARDNDFNTATANINNSWSTGVANINRTKTTADANANRTKATSDANAGYSRATAEENAKAALPVAQDAYTTRIEGAATDNPIAYGAASGDGLAEGYRMRGVHLRAKTQPDAAIARAGDTFIRYGYAYEGIWDVDKWCPTGHDFCYWKSSDLWLTVADIANPQAERALESIFESGVTIWADPDKIGRVRI